QPGQSAILEEASISSFESAWKLPSTDDVIVEDGSDNLGKTDTIYLFDGSTVVDTLRYGNGTGPVAKGVAAVPINAAALGANNISDWELLTLGQDGAIQAVNSGTPGDIAAPGY